MFDKSSLGLFRTLSILQKEFQQNFEVLHFFLSTKKMQQNSETQRILGNFDRQLSESLNLLEKIDSNPIISDRKSNKLWIELKHNFCRRALIKNYVTYHFFDIILHENYHFMILCLIFTTNLISAFSLHSLTVAFLFCLDMHN